MVVTEHAAAADIGVKAAKGGGNAMKKQKDMRADKLMVPGEWLYFTKEGVLVRQIAEALLGCCEVEIWEDAGVLEVMLTDGSSMDIEHVQIHPKDELTRSFARNEGCIEVFLVTFAPEQYEHVRGIMQQIMTVCGGLFCGDTEDFSPIVRVE